MKTPICDFVNQYISIDAVRMHMPGHKGKGHLGFEKYDITEITGADSLYLADGIIKESEENLTKLYESGGSFYSCEGSSHCIRAMMHLIKLYAEGEYVLASRNAHSSFISACALNDLDIEWLYPCEGSSYLSCVITPEKLEKVLSRVDKAPACVYITSPDYLGNMCDIAGLSQVCKNHGVYLVVDNAHGAYLKFLEKDMHPITLGADMCCDSAHKTLPALTGGAYLHVSRNVPDFFIQNVKSALSLFGSTSPSYLILSSLDNVNKYIAEGFKDKLNTFLSDMEKELGKCRLLTVARAKKGERVYDFCREPMKIVIESSRVGYTGKELAEMLHSRGVVCEFFDNDYLVLMPSLENGIDEIKNLVAALDKIEIRQPLPKEGLPLIYPKKVMSPRTAMFSPAEKIKVENALGRTLARSTLSCPPAVSVIVSGEEFNESIVELCEYYGFDTCYVVSEK